VKYGYLDHKTHSVRTDYQRGIHHPFREEEILCLVAFLVLVPVRLALEGYRLLGYEVLEIYKAHQGEGRVIGTPSIFIRLARCTLRCRNCDTKYAWRAAPELEMAVEEILDRVRSLGSVPLITITGGEPLLWALHPLVMMLEGHYQICIETNGTLPPGSTLLARDIIWSVSPKLESVSGVRSQLLFPVDKATYFKFVIRDERSMAELEDYINQYHIPKHKVILQPDNSLLGTKSYSELVRELMERAPDYVVLPQLHIWVYGRRRGV